MKQERPRSRRNYRRLPPGEKSLLFSPALPDKRPAPENFCPRRAAHFLNSDFYIVHLRRLKDPHRLFFHVSIDFTRGPRVSSFKTLPPSPPCGTPSTPAPDSDGDRAARSLILPASRRQPPSCPTLMSSSSRPILDCLLHTLPPVSQLFRKNTGVNKKSPMNAPENFSWLHTAPFPVLCSIRYEV